MDIARSNLRAGIPKVEGGAGTEEVRKGVSTLRGQHWLSLKGADMKRAADDHRCGTSMVPSMRSMSDLQGA
jgi:hypothetical protein